MILMLIIVWLHFIADFIMQTDKMALNKSTSWFWLTVHVAVYTAPFFVLFGWDWALWVFIPHFVTDAISSRLTTKLWKANQRHWFFVVIGADQALHMTALVWLFGTMMGLT